MKALARIAATNEQANGRLLVRHAGLFWRVLNQLHGKEPLVQLGIARKVDQSAADRGDHRGDVAGCGIAQILLQHEIAAGGFVAALTQQRQTNHAGKIRHDHVRLPVDGGERRSRRQRVLLKAEFHELLDRIHFDLRQRSRLRVHPLLRRKLRRLRHRNWNKKNQQGEKSVHVSNRSHEIVNSQASK